MSQDRIYFNHSPNPTIGVEAELYTVSKDTYELCSGAPKILEHFTDDMHVKEELLECIVEVNTGICKTISDVRKDLTTKIHEVNAEVEKNGNALISMGTHPFSKWKDQTITNSQRYLSFLERMQWPVRKLIISGKKNFYKIRKEILILSLIKTIYEKPQ